MDQRLELHRVQMSPDALGLLVIDIPELPAHGADRGVGSIFEEDVEPPAEDVQVDFRHLPLRAKSKKRCVMLIDGVVFHRRELYHPPMEIGCRVRSCGAVARAETLGVKADLGGVVLH